MDLYNYRDPLAAKKAPWAQYLSARLFRLSAPLREKVVNAGAIADFVAWQADQFGWVRALSTRENLWELMAQRLGGDVRGVELGVASGYGTGWWLRRLPGVEVRWDGFDRFTGLPRAWRGLDEGAFDTGGRPPDIGDPRVTWHVGNVEDTLIDLTLDRSDGFRLVVLFDLDIFEPSLVAWDYLFGSLRPGDMLYFDEAFDLDERRLLNEYVLPTGGYEPIGATPTGLALQVRTAPQV